MNNSEITIQTIEFMPLLKNLLKNYISLNYEENADYSNFSLVAEYHLLVRINKLNDLFDAELLTSAYRLQLEY
jgi:hypothetical protein